MTATWVEADVESLAARLGEFADSLPPAERRLFAELLIAAGERHEVTGYGLSLRSAAVAAALTALAGLGVAGGAGMTGGGGGDHRDAVAAKAVVAPSPAVPADPIAAAPTAETIPARGPEVTTPNRTDDRAVTIEVPSDPGDDMRQGPPQQPTTRPESLGNDMRQPTTSTTVDDRRMVEAERMGAPGDTGARYAFDYKGGSVSDLTTKPDPNPNAKPDPRATSKVSEVVAMPGNKVRISVTFTNTTDHPIVFDNMLRLHLFSGQQSQLEEVDLQGLRIEPGQSRTTNADFDAPTDGNYAIWLETM